jgi:hypothetical protein
MCFMGRMNRLVNSMVGIVENVQVGLSTREEIDLEIQALLKKFTSKNISLDECKKLMNELFETVELHIIPKNIQQSYIDALDDYEDDK